MKIKDDLKYQTPPDVCKYMVSMVPEESFRILEPTAGAGHIVDALRDKNKWFRIDTPGDIFSYFSNCSRYWDCIVMNPPFSDKYAFNVPADINEKGMRLGYYILTECMKRTDHVIALMPWFTISDSDVRLKFLKDYGLKSITALPRKTFQYARIQTMVLELERGYIGDTIFKTMYK